MPKYKHFKVGELVRYVYDDEYLSGKTFAIIHEGRKNGTYWIKDIKTGFVQSDMVLEHFIRVSDDGVLWKPFEQPKNNSNNCEHGENSFSKLQPECIALAMEINGRLYVREEDFDNIYNKYIECREKLMEALDEKRSLSMR